MKAASPAADAGDGCRSAPMVGLTSVRDMENLALVILTEGKDLCQTRLKRSFGRGFL